MLNGHPVNQLKEKHGTYHTMVLNMQVVKSKFSLIVGQIIVEILWTISSWFDQSICQGVDKILHWRNSLYG